MAGLMLARVASAQATMATVAADGVVEAARAAVVARLGTAYDNVQLVIAGRPLHPDYAKGRATFHVLPIVGLWPRSRFTVMVEVHVAGKVTQTLPVGFALSARAPALVYGEDASGGALADGLRLQDQSVDVAAAPGSLVVSRDEISGMRLRHAVRAGGPVKKSDFEAIPDVDIRQRVKVVASFGAIDVESTGVAMRAGNRGDVVTVQITGADRPVRATITDRGVARVVQ